MKILVTGGAGFIGSNIADAFIAAGHKVVIIDNLSSGKLRNVNKKAKFYQVDIRDIGKVNDVFKRERFDVINHHAAQIDVRKSVQDPIFDAQVNVLGTLNLLENCVKHKVKKVIFASSGGVMYGECGKNPPTETIPANPLSPYGVSKHTTEVYLRYYAATYGLKYLVFRYGNVYGPRQDPHGEAGVVAIFIQRIMSNAEINIFGNGKQLRDYVFVGDVVRANLRGLQKGLNEIINIGTQKASSVNTLFDELSLITGYSRKAIYKPPRLGELQKSFLNAGKAKKILGWQSIVSFKEGLAKTVEYFKNNR
ncbi:MAG: SDR family NAD(P)-dependent oxidoreductase [bacterium]|nr:SDR family NAD(P)-dependent oxidoreductase [bacterium]